MAFSSFEYALYFLNQGQAQRSMGAQWNWEEEIMGGPEPDWKNCFSWDEPGRLTTEEREIPVPLSVEYHIKAKLKFEELVPGQSESLLSRPQHDRLVCLLSDNNAIRIWRLCKGGIPPLIRPYIWTQLSGAHRLKRITNSQFKKIIPEELRKNATSAYEFLVKQVSC